jgi:hypothetical protein
MQNTESGIVEPANWLVVTKRSALFCAKEKSGFFIYLYISYIYLQNQSFWVLRINFITYLLILF